MTIVNYLLLVTVGNGHLNTAYDKRTINDSYQR